ncbi:hypothetical protein HYT25_01910 [Candidatus Pacearchaeota archaeon]|nr:hypothetical protein [Candidatus Pacearchaeota archaeon]
MKTRGEVNLPVIILLVFGLFTVGLGASYVYFSINGTDYSSLYSDRISSGEIKKPTTQFNQTTENNTESTENEINQLVIDKDLVRYFSSLLKVYNLHNIPYTSITPKIQIYIEDTAYFEEIIDGEIIINEGERKDKDIIIRTNLEEMAKMIEDSNYLKNSFSSGGSQIETVADKFTLFSKGYLNLYKEWTGTDYDNP